ncbi:peptidoglycan-binding protein [Streptomyces sp. NPDC046831]|uniref:peptidoglycan-binding protein n=1 Tax=Streptomyces sp. NPDC046831 TaxID=3154805 RepID=UPI0033E3DFDC
MSTPPGAGQQHGEDPPLEPVRVLRLRRTDALAELMREFREGTGAYDPVALPPAADGTEDATQELPPVPAEAPSGAGTRRGGAPSTGPSRASAPAPRSGRGGGDVPFPPPGHRTRRAAVALAVAAAALIGFGGALLLPGRGEQAAAGAPHPSATGPAAPAPSATGPPGSPAPPAATGSASVPGPAPDATAADDPDGPGTLRAGDSGPDVTELQVRLLRIPDVYRDGSTNGRYDAALEAAVARFQLWYGIRGDETGVYGDDTRRALEARTPAGGA